jgi:hypothetical protein
MSSPHTFVARFKPHSFGHGFDLWQDGIYSCDPKAPINITFGSGGGHGKGRGGNKKALTTVTCTLGTSNSTIEIKNGVTWTFGVVKVGPSKRIRAAAFKALVDAAVAAYIP